MPITAEIIAEFRARYPQFADTAVWPDSVVSSALCEADAQTGSSRWGAYQDDCHNTKQRGMFFYACSLTHSLLSQWWESDT